jgi:DNA helicase-2/ATP-dependent DNA helicase PcrA
MVIASAGSRKTTSIVERALSLTDSSVLITTYTNENIRQLKSYFVRKHGCVPPNVSIIPWFSFLLREGVRPYQTHLTSKRRVRSIQFDDLPRAAKYASKRNPIAYYLDAGNSIYRDRVSEFICDCDELTGGSVISRLQRIYGHLFIDEFQDCCGYDLDLIEKLLRSTIKVTIVADPRQATFQTNNSLKNSKFKKSGLLGWVQSQQSSGLVSVQEWCECHRSNQEICNFADALYPEFPKTISKNSQTTGHDGIFYLNRAGLAAYYQKYRPVVLRYSKTTATLSLPAVNIGISKGRTFDRVLIFPTAKWKAYLNDKKLGKVGDRAKLYVAVTRARFSVAFVIDAVAKESSARKP